MHTQFKLFPITWSQLTLLWSSQIVYCQAETIQIPLLSFKIDIFKINVSINLIKVFKYIMKQNGGHFF